MTGIFILVAILTFQNGNKKAIAIAPANIPATVSSEATDKLPTPFKSFIRYQRILIT